MAREYDKLQRPSTGLTFDSLNSWFNSHLGLVGEKKNIEKFIQHQESFQQSNQISERLFRETYKHFGRQTATSRSKREKLVLIISFRLEFGEDSDVGFHSGQVRRGVFLSFLVDRRRCFSQVSVNKFAARVTNNDPNGVQQESKDIRKLLGIDKSQREIPLRQCISYLWSDANSAFDPVSRSTCEQDMDHVDSLAGSRRATTREQRSRSSERNHRISRRYLAKTQLFNPSSVHCYIQALLKGCKCIESKSSTSIEFRVERNFQSTCSTAAAVPSRSSRTRTRGFVRCLCVKCSKRSPITPSRRASEPSSPFFVVHFRFRRSFPVIISIENHCSAEQRKVMARMFCEIFGGQCCSSIGSSRFFLVPSEFLLQFPFSTNETHLPSPNQLKRKIILKVKLLEEKTFLHRFAFEKRIPK